jgi:hypothetical protein
MSPRFKNIHIQSISAAIILSLLLSFEISHPLAVAPADPPTHVCAYMAGWTCRSRSSAPQVLIEAGDLHLTRRGRGRGALKILSRSAAEVMTP